MCSAEVFVPWGRHGNEGGEKRQRERQKHSYTVSAALTVHEAPQGCYFLSVS